MLSDKECLTLLTITTIPKLPSIISINFVFVRKF